MGERDKGDGRDIRVPSMDLTPAARDRESALRTLRRLADALGRPVEDFFKIASDGSAPGDKADGEGQT